MKRDIKNNPALADYLNKKSGIADQNPVRAVYEIHPVAEKFPVIPASEYAELKESIRKFGQFDPIVIADGKILDGRHRYRICCELGLEPIVVDFTQRKDKATENLSIADFIFDANAKRRHLTDGQRAAIAAEFANMRSGERTDLEPSDNRLKVSQQEAADRLKVSRKSVSRAKQVKEADAATFAELKAGEVSLNAAVAKVKKKEKPAVKKAVDVVPADSVEQRNQLWIDSCAKAREAIEELISMQEAYESEYEEMSRSQQDSARGQILNALCCLELDSALYTIEDAEQTEAP
jgi:ParB-like chromosome segregation protein Spo0J